jgi:replicative DNA helicase
MENLTRNEFLHIQLKIEQSLISKVQQKKLNDFSILKDVIEESFYYKQNWFIFSYLVEHLLDNKAIDYSQMKIYLKNKDSKIDVNNLTFDDEYESETFESLKKLGNDIIAKINLSKLMNNANQAIQNGMGVDELTSKIIQRSEHIRSSTLNTEIETYGDISEEHMHDLYEKSEQIKNGIIPGALSGISSLDSILKGSNEGDFVVIGARPSMGKTSLAISIISNLLKFKQKGREGVVVFFSLEMPAKQVYSRLYSCLDTIPLNTMMNGYEYDTYIHKINEVRKMLQNEQIIILDKQIDTIEDMKAKLLEIKKSHGTILMAFMDYIQLAKSKQNYSNNRVTELSYISRECKLIAKDLEFPFFVLAQLNRNLELRTDKRPMNADLKDSGAIEQDADVILFVYRDDIYKEQELRESNTEEAQKKLKELKQKEVSEGEIIISKNRNGPLGTANVVFVKNRAYYVDESLIDMSEYNNGCVVTEFKVDETGEDLIITNNDGDIVEDYSEERNHPFSEANINDQNSLFEEDISNIDMPIL